jgi:ABC-type transport system involved in multi-copper enzyme maturation permease subunit
MNTIWMIAAGTFGEAMRRKILNVFLFVGLALMLMFFAFTSFQPHQELIIIKSVGFGVIGLAGVFISVILGINLIPNEIERRTIYTILSKPVQRYQFICGKFFGGLATVFTNIALMGIVFIAVVTYKVHVLDLSLVTGIVMILFQLTLLNAVALFFSVFLSQFVNFFLTFAVNLLGSMSSVTESLMYDNGKKSWIFLKVAAFVHYVVPNFANFNIQNPIINPHVEIANEGAYIAYNIGYAISYTAILLLLAVLIFNNREV